MTALRLRATQGTPEWLAVRRGLITATDIPIILGVSPWQCEQDLADAKLNGVEQESSLRMRVGTALQDLVAAEYEAMTGQRVRRYHAMLVSSAHPWAACSPDFGIVGRHRLLEVKTTGSRSRFADGLPDDVTAQVAWQCMVAEVEGCDVAVLVSNEAVLTFAYERDRELEANLLTVAVDFRARLAAGGPFAQSAESVKRRFPADDGSEITADAEVAQAVSDLLRLRSQRKAAEAAEEALEVAIKTRMGPATVMTGPGWRVTWKATKDREETDWKSVSAAALASMPETDRTAIVGLHTTVRPGFRPLRVVLAKED